MIARFPVAWHYCDAVDTLHKQEVRRLGKEVPQEQRTAPRRARWPFDKRSADFTDEEQARLDGLLGHSPALAQASTLREQLTRIFERARSKVDGLRRIRF